VTDQALTKELVYAWLTKRPQETDVTWEHRMYAIRQFARYLTELGYEAYIPYRLRKIHRQVYVPYIFTPEELQRFFQACDQIPPHPLSSKCLVFPALFRVLYGCGLRISEAVALRGKDVDLETGVLTIRRAKFDKDRLIPMAPSLTQYLTTYTGHLHLVSDPGSYFFPQKDRTALQPTTVYKNFRTLLWRSGISHGGPGRGPRLHDFRHSFATHALQQMVRRGLDLYCALPILSTYLGHASVAATERYVRLTADQYPDLLQAINQTCAHLFPEVVS
jgi:integrase